ncbi:MAG TPA: 23S rRNA (adenine(2503)-C(2))-methyltransferase RlmN [Clostridia bacterium]|nr:23S rRNA (adenine(2503)-C(2))-methyltransferase RlmN [Clostridia bacterium]
MLSLQDLDYNEIKELIKELGQPSFRADQVFDMAMKDKDYAEVTNLPKSLIAGLAERYRARAVEVIAEYRSRDGSVKYLYRLFDGNIVEGVFMPHDYGNTVCISTQVGCRMGCAFCASGIGGLARNLTAGEMLGQVLAANRLNGGTPKKRTVTNIVLMGSGEPLDNYENVIKFIKAVSFGKGINISQRNISLSTVGLADRIRQLADDGLNIILTISLHAPTDEKRNALIPMNRKYPIKDIIGAARYYFEKTGRRIIFEYTLAEGKNSDAESAEELSRLLKGLNCHVNLIKLNYVKEKGLKSANDDSVKEFLSILQKNKISATLRRSMGQDIEGACGQLRRKYLGES